MTPHIFHKSRTTGQFVRYMVAGISCGLVDYGLLLLLAEYAHFYYLLAAAIAFTVSETMSFFISIHWAFVVHNRIRRGMLYFLFQIVAVIGLALTVVGIWWLTGIPWMNSIGLGINRIFQIDLPLYLIPKIATNIAVFFWNFATKRWLLSKYPERYFKRFLRPLPKIL